MDLRDTILQGDCLTLLRTLPDNSIDACVTDPPAGISFMGKGWDGDKGGRHAWVGWLTEVMSECLRVVKPGGHALVWALPRTSHWTACALEDAGWEIRDCLYHIFGSGFPKSLDVSKAIDHAAGAEREVVGYGPSHDGALVRMNDDAWQPRVGPTPITNPATCEAQTWQGWGTALKPAIECWWLVRKPLAEGTVAANVLHWSTGALNVDGCRISFASAADEQESKAKNQHGDFGSGGRNEDGSHIYGIDKAPRTNYTAQGRWPANLLISHTPWCVEGGNCVEGCPAAVLDAQSGYRPRSGRHGESGSGKPTGLFGMGSTRQQTYWDDGGASRYFAQFYYSAKASRAERDAGLEHLPTRTAGEATDREDGTAGLNSPRAGAGRTGDARNIHPTVKPQSLMRWLCRLITPPGGIVLDPFGGSGSTAVAAIAEGFRCVVMEREADYLPIIEGRVAYAKQQHTPARAPIAMKKRTRQPIQDDRQLNLWTA